MRTVTLRALVLAVVPALALPAQDAPAKFGFFGSAGLAYGTSVTLNQPAGAPFGVPEPRYEIGKTRPAIGGGILVGLAINRIGFFGTMEVLGTTFDLSPGLGSYGGSSFRSDIGVRFDVPSPSRKVSPYLIGAFGYYDISFRTNDPIIYTGPGGGYDSGVTTYDGTALSYGVGVELARWPLSAGVGVRRLDVRLTSSTASFGGDYPPEDVNSLKLSVGMTWWVRKGLR